MASRLKNDEGRLPAELGYRMPAEWESHAATWIAWPHRREDWPGKILPIPWVFCEFVRKIAPGETVRVLVKSKAHEARARHALGRVGVNLEHVEFFRFPTDRGWTRDYGPLFLKRDGRGAPESGNGGASLAIARFQFNAWAKYPEFQKDNAVPERAARALRLKLFHARHRGQDVVLEGGSIDVNGRGSLLTTEECLLDPAVQARNPGLSRKDLEAVLRGYLGVTHVLWLGRGIAGDDTHGHVDDIARFVGPRTIAIASEENPRDSNYRALQENRERLQGLRLEDGTRPEIVALPSPAPLYLDGQRLPASYANFYIANAAVLVPTFNDPKDREALGILAELFPGRPVVGIHAVDLVGGLGAVHCLTQQQPAP